MNSKVIAVGNILLKDEGVGIKVLSAFLEQHKNSYPEVEFIDGGTLSFTLLEHFTKDSSLILLDAAQLNATAGEVQVFINEAMDEFLGKVKRSAHEVGLLDLFDMARLSDNLPKKRAIIGIQPQEIDWGEELSEMVKLSVLTAVNELKNLLDIWQK